MASIAVRLAAVMPAPVILGFDPGKNNMGFCVLHRGRRRYRIHQIGMLADPLRSLLPAEFDRQARAFRRTVRRLLREHRPQIIVFERMLNRGRFFGGTTELISAMLGIIWELCRQQRILLLPITAATWKNKFQRQTGQKLPELYKALKPLPPHTVDSALIGLFASDRLTPYANWRPKFFCKVQQRW